MELSLLLISLPAIIALLFKGGIFAYARFSKTDNLETHLFLYFLFALSIQNICEISHFFVLNRNAVPTFEATAFYGAAIIAIAILFHLAFVLAFNRTSQPKKRFPVVSVIYIYAFILELLLIFTPWLISDFVPFGYSVTRVAGPVFLLFEIYAIGTILSVIGMLLYGSIYQNTAQKRAKNSVMLLAIIPMTLVVISVLTLLHFDIKWFNASVTNTIAMTFFLCVTAYAIHQHRLFDIQFYIPWSKVRKRKTAFYNRIRAMIAEIADLKSSKETIGRLADTLRCPVVLVGGNKSIIAGVSGSHMMANFPQKDLGQLEDIIVANEITDSLPQLHKKMKLHGVAAIVPFYPHSQHASGWLLLGDSFSEEVYTPLDFWLVEQLFDKMADLFLDKLLTFRTQLVFSHNQIRTLEAQRTDMQSQLSLLQSEVETLRQYNNRLLKEQLADSISHNLTEQVKVAGMITHVGRDKIMLKTLRNYFPQTAQFVGSDLSNLKREIIPDVLICKLGKYSSSMQKKLLGLITMHRGKTAVLLYGPEAKNFTQNNNRILVGSMVELLSENISDEALTRKIRSLIQLRKYTYAIPYMDYPLIGQSQVFTNLITETHRVAGFMETVLIKSQDREEAVTLAAYIHKLDGRSGRFNVIRSVGLRVDDAEEQIAALLDDSHTGTLMVDNVYALPQGTRGNLFVTASKHDIRLIIGCDRSVVPSNEISFGINHVFTLEIPELRERKLDIPLLVHYFTLQFNLQAGKSQYIRLSEIDNLITLDYPKNIASVKSFVFDKLQSKEQKVLTQPSLDENVGIDKSLDEHVNQFEAGIIEQTLKRCNGNKSRAAKLLGMRPNTLHYKLARHGLTNIKKK